ncbi:MAG TPA: hypothetical protein VK186_24745, partial [Candidatus Deferrimicrobium sp.]|nr:hypothetical protein [Candidatus Deferrimicrobium sp.]
MSRLNIKLTKTTFIFISILYLAAALLGQERLEYELSVDVRLVPVFAVDSRGNPVYDLQKEEVELYAEGKPADIFYFNSYQVDAHEKNNPDENEPATEPVKSPERINFIILDTLLGNKNTMALNRAVALGIINNATPGDAFIILDSNQVRGLQYIIGPEKDKKVLTQALNEIEKLYIQRRVRMSADLLGEYSKISGNAKEIMEAVWGAERETVKKEKEQYQSDIRILAQSLEQLKYAMKTITLPKTVFLITTGPMKDAIEGIPVTYYRFLEDAARAINLGGSMLVVINPLMSKSKSAGTELKFMTDEVGGKCINGANLDDIITKVKNSTSAYYELAFYPEQKNDPLSRIILKCKREGVEL